MREMYDRFMEVLRDIDINSLTYDEMEKVARICSAVMLLKRDPFEMNGVFNTPRKEKEE